MNPPLTRPNDHASSRRSGSVASLLTALDARLALLVAFGATSGAGYAITLTAGWLLAPDQFGLVAAIQTVAFVGGLVLDSALTWPLSRAIAQAPSSDWSGLLRRALAGNLAISGVAALTLIGLFATGPLRPLLESWSITLALAVALPGLAIATAIRAAWIGADIISVAASIQTLEAGARTIVVVGLLGAGTGAVGAAIGVGVGAWLAAILAVVSARPHFWPLVQPVRSLRLNRIAVSGHRETLGSFAALIGIALALNSDLLLVKTLSPDGGREAALYQAAVTLSRAPYFLTVALIPLLFTRLVRSPLGPAATATLRRILLIVLATVAGAETVLLVSGPTLLGWLLPATYGASANILTVSAIGHVPACLCAVLIAALQARGAGMNAARVVFLVVSVQIAVLCLVAPTNGATGAALVSAVAFFVLAGLLARAAFRATALVARSPSPPPIVFIRDER